MKLQISLLFVFAAVIPRCGSCAEDVESMVRNRTPEEEQSFNEVRRLTTALWKTRLGIREGRVLLNTRCETHAASPIRESITTTREIVFRDEHLFVKRKELRHDKMDQYFVVLGPGYSYDLQDPDYPVNVNFAEPLQIPDARVFHPRTLGLFAANLDTYYVNHEHAAEFSLSESMSTVAARERRIDADGNEQLYVRVESLSPQIDTVVRYWFSTTQQHMPVRIVVSSDEMQISDDCTVMLQEIAMPAGDVWFPKVLEYTRRESGVLTEHEVTDVVEADFSLAVDDEAFSLARIDTGIRAEAVIDRHIVQPIIDGQIADDDMLTEYAAAPSPEHDGRRSARAWFLLFNSLLAGAFLVWLLCKGRDS